MSVAGVPANSTNETMLYDGDKLRDNLRKHAERYAVERDDPLFEARVVSIMCALCIIKGQLHDWAKEAVAQNIRGDGLKIFNHMLENPLDYMEKQIAYYRVSQKKRDDGRYKEAANRIAHAVFELSRSS